MNKTQKKLAERTKLVNVGDKVVVCWGKDKQTRFKGIVDLVETAILGSTAEGFFVVATHLGATTRVHFDILDLEASTFVYKGAKYLTLKHNAKGF